MSNMHPAENPDDLTTDATPDGPRPTKPDCHAKSENDENNKNEPKYPTHSKKTCSNSYVPRKKPAQKSKKSNVSTNVVTIVNSNNVHVGSVKNFNLFPNVTSKVDKKPDAPDESRKTDKSDRTRSKLIEKLLQHDEVLAHTHMDFVASHLMEGWKRVGLDLGFSNGQLDQIYNDHKDFTSKEVIYQMLLAWSQDKTHQATVKALAQALWDNEQEDVVRRWAQHLFAK